MSVERSIATGFDEASRIALAIGQCVAALEALGQQSYGHSLRQLVIHELGGRLPPAEH
jgi:hypothetical protein